ncbi:MAG: molybdopterin-binding protein [Myxococcota bacterium]
MSTEPPAIPRAAALIIGNELLSGKIADANVVVLARTLRACGWRLDRVLVIPDELDLIAREVRQLSEDFDAVFTSGGVGPTHDDLTVDAVAQAFGVEAAPVAALEQMIQSRYEGQATPGHLRMARAPTGARLVSREAFPWPTIVMHNVWVFPGVPQIFAMKMALLRQELGSASPFITVELKTQLDEGHLKPHLDAVVSAHPTVQVGSYPKWRDPECRTLVTFDGLDEREVEAAKASLASSLARRSSSSSS